REQRSAGLLLLMHPQGDRRSCGPSASSLLLHAKVAEEDLPDPPRCLPIPIRVRRPRHRRIRRWLPQQPCRRFVARRLRRAPPPPPPPRSGSSATETPPAPPQTPAPAAAPRARSGAAAPPSSPAGVPSPTAAVPLRSPLPPTLAP